MMNIEKGTGHVVTEAEYRVGLSTGRFLPAPQGKHPSYKKEPLDLMAIAGEEYNRGFWRKLGELSGEEAFRDPKRRKELQLLMDVYRMKQVNESFKED